MICFQILYLWYSDTTFRNAWHVGCKLWFAFKFYIFDILIQLRCRSVFRYQRCDLLSNFISLIFWYNLPFNRDKFGIVVICFQILYLWYSDTTQADAKARADKLWFAFKFYIFDILIQQYSISGSFCAGCDLLSNFISLIFWYNANEKLEDAILVVICFQILYLWYSDTTRMWMLRWIDELWFAFKFYIFDILIQLFLLL